MKNYIYILISVIILNSCGSAAISYFDQSPPSRIPKLFGPGIINTDEIELNVVFNANYTELFFSRIVENSFVIHHSELINGKWSQIKPLKLYDENVLVSVACDPTISEDGKTMYFLGVDPKLYNSSVTREELFRIPPDIYMSKKVNGQWGIGKKLEFSISTEHLETYPVVTSDGSLYFRSNRPSEKKGMQTYRAQYLGNDEFDLPIMISMDSDKKELITYVSPDERFAITNGHGKFQITYNNNGVWTKPKEISLPYDSNWRYYAPYISSDGKYFMYSRRYNNPNKKGWAGVEKGEVYWVSTDLIFNSK